MVMRCEWTGSDPLMVDYHDREWGVSVHDDRLLFEFLILEGAQAGLSWATDQWPPMARSPEGLEFGGASDEHLVATLTTSDARQLRPGDKEEIIPGHNDTTVNLHSHLFALRKGRLETVWEVGARGRIR